LLDYLPEKKISIIGFVKWKKTLNKNTGNYVSIILTAMQHIKY